MSDERFESVLTDLVAGSNVRDVKEYDMAILEILSWVIATECIDVEYVPGQGFVVDTPTGKNILVPQGFPSSPVLSPTKIDLIAHYLSA